MRGKTCCLFRNKAIERIDLVNLLLSTFPDTDNPGNGRELNRAQLEQSRSGYVQCLRVLCLVRAYTRGLHRVSSPVDLKVGEVKRVGTTPTRRQDKPL